MKRHRSLIYHYLDLVHTDDIEAAIKDEYKIRLEDTVKCYYVKIPGRLGKNVVAQDQKTVERYFRIPSWNVSTNVCRVMEIDIDLSGYDFKKVARQNQEERMKNIEKRLSTIRSSTQAKR